MCLAEEGRRRAKQGQERVLVAPPQRPVRGERGHSQVPSLEHILHVPAVLPHHKQTHANGQGVRSKQRRSKDRAHLNNVYFSSLHM